MSDDVSKPNREPAGQGRRRHSLYKKAPGSVDTLRSYYKDRLTEPDFEKIFASLMEESDRAAVILLASLLDDILLLRIAHSFSFMPEPEDIEKTFRFQGPLGSFSNRMEIACLFGIIDETTFNQLNAVREMRNACAHSKLPLRFEDPVLANVAMRVLQPLGAVPPPKKPELMRPCFVMEMLILINTINVGSRQQAVATLFPQGVPFPLPDKWR